MSTHFPSTIVAYHDPGNEPTIPCEKQYVVKYPGTHLENAITVEGTSSFLLTEVCLSIVTVGN